MDKKVIITEGQLGLLLEYAGINQSIEDYAVEILEVVQSRADKERNTFEPFGLDCPYSLGNIIYIVPTQQNVRAAYGRMQGKTRCIIYINLDNVDIFKEYDIIPTLVHELTHAYEDKLRLENGADSVIDLLMKQNSCKALNAGCANNNMKGEIGWMVQTTQDFELNARIAQISSCLQNWTGNDLETPQEVIEIIKQTRPYKGLMKQLENLDWVINTRGPKKQQAKVDIFNSVSNLNFKTFKQLQHWCEVKKKNIKERLRVTIPRIVKYYFDYVENE